MSRTTIHTPRGTVTLEPIFGADHLRVKWPTGSDIGPIAVRNLERLGATWHPRTRSWHLRVSDIDAFRTALAPSPPPCA